MFAKKKEAMTTSGEDSEHQNVSHSTAPVDVFQKIARAITKMVTQQTFDKISMVLAEVIGTGMLMFFGCAGAVGWPDIPRPFGISTPLNFGLTVMMIIQIFGHISYALLNPAVSICAVVNNLISVKVSANQLISEV